MSARFPLPDTPMRLFLALAALAVPLAARAQPPAVPHPDKLAAITPALQGFIDKGELAGAVVAVGRSTGVVHLAAVGSLRLDPATPMPPDALFRIASMTKPVTALAVMMLVEDGKIASVNDPVMKYLPEFTGQMLVKSKSPDVVTLVKPTRPITLKDLLTHTSGLPGGYPAGLGNVYGKRDRTLAETTLVISQRPLEFEPGSKWAYCNAGIDTLGRVVEVVSGQGYEQFLQARLFGPLSMADTTTAPTAAQRKRLAVTYGLKDGKLTPAGPGFLDAVPAPMHPIPAGGLCSTAADFAKLYQCLLNKGELGGKRVIKAETLAQMTTPRTGDLKPGFTDGMSFGLGFAVVKTPTSVTASLSPGSFGHGGAFGTQVWADPTRDFFVILLIARSDVGNADGSKYRRAVQDLAAAAVRP